MVVPRMQILRDGLYDKALTDILTATVAHGYAVYGNVTFYRDRKSLVFLLLQAFLISLRATDAQ